MKHHFTIRYLFYAEDSVIKSYYEISFYTK